MLRSGSQLRHLFWHLFTLLYLIVLPVVLTALLMYLCIIYLMTFLPSGLTRRFFRPVARHWCKMFTKSVLADLQLVRTCEFDLPDQFILIANHPSLFEDFGVPALFDVHPLAKSGVRKWFFLGRISEYGGTIFVHRKDADSRKNALNAMKQAVRSGHNLIVFPEGGCNGKDIQDSFKSGAFEVSMETGVPILPVYLHYLDEQAYVWEDQSILLKVVEILLARDKRVRYVLYPPISSDAYKNKFEFAEAVRYMYLKWQKENREKDWN